MRGGGGVGGGVVNRGETGMWLTRGVNWFLSVSALVWQFRKCARVDPKHFSRGGQFIVMVTKYEPIKKRLTTIRIIYKV